MGAVITKFFHWLGAQEKDHPVWRALEDCMRFLVLAAVAGGVLWSGAAAFDVGEARTSGVLGLIGLWATKRLMKA